jgi:hypothetical protein
MKTPHWHATYSGSPAHPRQVDAIRDARRNKIDGAASMGYGHYICWDKTCPGIVPVALSGSPCK